MRAAPCGQLLQRSDFSERMAAERPIGVHELLYPLLQGYDFVAVDADLEIGGTDQLFNLLAARDVQRWYGRPVQDVATFPILEGTDGVRKMSKSLGNYIGVAEPAEEQYGKAMSIPNSLIVRWLTLATDVAAAEVEEIARGLAAEEVNPRDAKARMARAIVAQFHGADAAERAEAAFRAVHASGGFPDDMPEAALPTGEGTRDAVGFVADALRAAGEGGRFSGTQLRQIFAQGGASLNDPERGARGPARSQDAGALHRRRRRGAARRARRGRPHGASRGGSAARQAAFGAASRADPRRGAITGGSVHCRWQQKARMRNVCSARRAGEAEGGAGRTTCRSQQMGGDQAQEGDRRRQARTDLHQGRSRDHRGGP